MKKFGVGSCSALKNEEEKKACYKALDDAHVADHEEQVQVKEDEVVKRDSKGELIKRDGYSIKYKPGKGYIYVRKSQTGPVRPSDIGRGSKSAVSNIGRRNEEVVKEAVTTGGIEYGEQDWDMQHRLDQAAPYMDSNFAEFYEQGLEGPYIWHGETYFFDRKVGGWYSVTAEDYVDDEISKDLSLWDLQYVLLILQICMRVALQMKNLCDTIHIQYGLLLFS